MIANETILASGPTGGVHASFGPIGKSSFSIATLFVARLIGMAPARRLMQCGAGKPRSTC